MSSGGWRRSAWRAWQDSPKWSFAGLAILAAGTLVLVALTMRPPDPSPGATSGTPIAIPSDTPTADPVKAAVDEMGHVKRPYTLTVFGDSTGFQQNRWPYRVAAWIGDHFKRTVRIETWNPAAEKYDAPVTVRTVAGTKPLTVLNASAPGMNPQYNVSHYDAMTAPSEADLVIINHGHNMSPEFARTDMDALYGFLDVPTLVTVQNREDGAEAAKQAKTLRVVRQWAKDAGAPVIDVEKAFGPAPARYLLDDRHPNDAGSELWARTVEKALTAAR